MSPLVNHRRRRPADFRRFRQVPRRPPTMDEEYKDLENRITKLQWVSATAGSAGSSAGTG